MSLDLSASSRWSFAKLIDANMAQENDAPKALDKGKGKAVENPQDEKQVMNGKKDDDKDKGEYRINQDYGMPIC